MKNLIIYLSALAGMALTACSDAPDVPKEIELSDVPIQLDVNVGGITTAPFSRAAVEVQNNILTTENIKEHTWANSINTLMTVDDRYWFRTWLNYQYDDSCWGFHYGYGDNDAHINDSENQHYSDKEFKLYWPEHHAVNMYFVANGVVGLDGIDNHHQIVYSPDIKVKGQTPYFYYKSRYNYNTSDILYGMIKEAKRPTGKDNPINSLTLYHAMAKLKYEFEVRTPLYRVEIENIEPMNVYTEGKFKFLDNGNIEWYDLANRATVTHGAGCCCLDRLYVGYDDGVKTARFRSDDHYNGDDIKSPHDKLDSYYYGREFYHLVVPQRVEALRPPFSSDCNSGYLRVWLRIIATDGNKPIYPESGDAGVFIPLGNGNQGVTWEQGKEYTYHIVFNDGAGWDDTNNLPVLSLINVDCTVADWTTDPGDWDVKVN